MIIVINIILLGTDIQFESSALVENETPCLGCGRWNLEVGVRS